MKISVPRERKQGETRVAITPEMVSELTARGHDVCIEQDAGALSHFPDDAYRDAGAAIAGSLEEVWSRAELLVKVKEPAPEELALLQPGMAVFSFLHPAANPEMTRALIKHKVTALDYDLLRTADNALPILRPMSEIAGKLAVHCGASALQADCGGRGLLLGGSTGVEPAQVVVVGAGTAGSAAAFLSLSIGAETTVLDIDELRLKPFRSGTFPGAVRPLISNNEVLEREIQSCDLLIGAVLVPGAVAPKLLTRSLLRKMRPGAVLVDICIDQGGFAESSRATSIAEPTYVEEGVVHYCVPNMPALVPRTSTRALTNASFPYLALLAERGITGALEHSAEIRSSLISIDGACTNSVVADALGIEVRPYERLRK